MKVFQLSGTIAHGKAEVFTDGKWSDIDDHPGGGTQTYATAYHENKFYYFGGVSGSNDQDSIACLNSLSWTWSLAGKLQKARRAHSVIVVGNKFLVVGGYGTFNTEGSSVEKTIVSLGSFLFRSFSPYTPTKFVFLRMIK